MTLEDFVELLAEERNSLKFKGNIITIADGSTPERIIFKWGKKQKTIHPNWDNPNEISVMKKTVEQWINELIQKR